MGIGLPVLCGGIEILAEGKELIALLHRLISPATGEQHGEDNAIQYGKNLSHTLLKRKNSRFISSVI
jgi:hypothetical protein